MKTVKQIIGDMIAEEYVAPQLSVSFVSATPGLYTSLDYSPVRRIVLAAGEKTLSILDPYGNREADLRPPLNLVKNVRVSTDGNILAVWNPEVVAAFDSQRNIGYSFEAFTPGVVDVAVRESGRDNLLHIGSYSGLVEQWNIPMQRHVRSIQTIRQPQSAPLTFPILNGILTSDDHIIAATSSGVDVSKDGSRVSFLPFPAQKIALLPFGELVIASFGRILLWEDLSNPSKYRWIYKGDYKEIPRASAITSIATHSLGRYVVAGTDKGKLIVIDLLSGESIVQVPDYSPISQVLFTIDNHFLAQTVGGSLCLYKIG